MNIKFIICFFYFITLISAAYSQQAYYVSNNGNNALDGHTPANALETVDKAVNLMGSGDTLYLRRGDIFRESINFKDQGDTIVYIDAYGDKDKAKPVISGSVEITGWALWKDGIYKATCAYDIKNLFVDNELMIIARYPDEGWLAVDDARSESGHTVIESDELVAHPANADDIFNGGKMRWRRWSWWFETRDVLDYDDVGELHISGGVGSKSVNNWGFYIDHVLDELDCPGEWYMDEATNTVYLYPEDGKTPENCLIEGAYRDEGFLVSGSVVKNICFRHQTANGLHIMDNSKVLYCCFEGIGCDNGGSALEASWSATNAEVGYCMFKNNLNVAIGWNTDFSSPDSSFIHHDTIINTGVIPAYGGSYPWHAAGIIVYNANNLHIEHNYIDHTGYAGIILGEEGNFVEYNTIKRAMSTLNDGAAIYTNCNRSTIRYNLIFDTEGDLDQVGFGTNLGHGIWPEFLSDFRESVIEYNTVVGSGGFGLFLPNNFECTVMHNTFYDNERAQIDLSGRETNSSVGRYDNLPQNHIINDNIFFAADVQQKALTFEGGFDYGKLNGNYYCNPFDWFMIEGDGAVFDVAHFGDAFSWADTTGKTDQFKFADYLVTKRFDNLLSNGTFDSNANGWMIDASSDEATLSFNPNSALDNGALELKHNGGVIMFRNKDYLELEAGKYYEFKFEYICDSLGDNQGISSRQFNPRLYDEETGENIFSLDVAIDLKRQKGWGVFKCEQATQKALIRFYDLANKGNIITIDNIELREVITEEYNSADMTKIVYNTNEFATDIDIGEGDWQDIYGNDIQDNVALEPFTSKILINKKIGYMLSLNDMNIFRDAKLKGQEKQMLHVYPNPVKKYLTIQSLESLMIVKILNSNGTLVETIRPDDRILTIDVTGFKPGIYLLNAIDIKGYAMSEKVIVK